jgi:hypothetical protein
MPNRDRMRLFRGIVVGTCHLFLHAVLRGRNDGGQCPTSIEALPGHFCQVHPVSDLTDSALLVQLVALLLFRAHLPL